MVASVQYQSCFLLYQSAVVTGVNSIFYCNKENVVVLCLVEVTWNFLK